MSMADDRARLTSPFEDLPGRNDGRGLEDWRRSTAEAPPHLLQFSLLSMFLVTLIVAITCSVAFSMPTVVSIPLLALFSVTLAAVLITVIVYGRDYQRTFCIGALVPFGVLLMSLGFAGTIIMVDGPIPRDHGLLLRLALVGVWASSILVGGVCVGVRRLIEKRST